jgi:hypothetical protein
MENAYFGKFPHKTSQQITVNLIAQIQLRSATRFLLRLIHFYAEEHLMFDYKPKSLPHKQAMGLTKVDPTVKTIIRRV